MVAINALQPTLRLKCHPVLSKGPSPFIHYNENGQSTNKTNTITRKRNNPTSPQNQPPRKKRKTNMTAQQRRQISCTSGSTCKFRGCGYKHQPRDCCKYGIRCRNNQCKRVHTSYHNTSTRSSTCNNSYICTNRYLLEATSRYLPTCRYYSCTCISQPPGASYQEVFEYRYMQLQLQVPARYLYASQVPVLVC